MDTSNTKIVKSIGISKLPLTGKLCAVDVTNKKFKLGKLTFQLDYNVPLTEIKEFIEEFVHLNIDTPLENEYFEDVKIDFIENDTTNVTDSTVDYFTGIILFNEIGVILKLGVEFPKENSFNNGAAYIFRYYPQNLTFSSNNFNLFELTNTI